MQLTESAKKVLKILFEKNNMSFFRVFIRGGGCSGFEYDFQLEAEAADDDYRIAFEHGELIVDPLSWNYLSDAVLDHQKNLTGARFIVHNPLVKRTCGCGSSFAL